MHNGVVYHAQFLIDDLMEETAFNATPMELISPKVPNFKNENVSFKNHYLFLSLIFQSFEKRVK